MLAEFKEFVNRGNFVDLAVAFVMGVAITTVVQALVNRVVMPGIGLIFGEANFDNLLTFGEAVGEDGVPVGSFGAVISALVTLGAVSLVLFLIVRAYNRLQRRRPEEPEPEAEPEDVVLLRQIRDALTDRPAPTGVTPPPDTVV